MSFDQGWIEERDCLGFLAHVVPDLVAEGGHGRWRAKRRSDVGPGGTLGLDTRQRIFVRHVAADMKRWRATDERERDRGHEGEPATVSCQKVIGFFRMSLHAFPPYDGKLAGASVRSMCNRGLDGAPEELHLLLRTWHRSRAGVNRAGRRVLLKMLRRRRGMSQPATGLYSSIVEQSRDPAFFCDLNVPDTILGRFEMIALHAFLVFRRLRDAGGEGRELAQLTHDLMFADIDRSLRELGIGDMGIGKRVKSLARNLYGRIAAYDEGLGSDEAVLVEALRRNVYATMESVGNEKIALLAVYLRREAEALRMQTDEALLSGQVSFGGVPHFDSGTTGTAS